MKFDDDVDEFKEFRQTKITDEAIYSVMSFVIIFLLIASFAFRGACVDDAATKRAVEKQGYTEVKLHDKGIFAVGIRGCDGKDAAKYAAKAKNAQGKEVDLIICVGWPFKGTTVRTE